MDISMVAINRIVEVSIEDGTLPISKFKKSGKTVLSQVREMEDDEIIKRLNSLGLHFKRADFAEWVASYSSAESLSRWLGDYKNLDLTNLNDDFLWMGLTVLWERWFPEVPNFEMLDDKMYSGYMLKEKGKMIEACDLWWDLWRDITYLMDRHKISGIEAFDNLFRGTQYVTNWATDFALELDHAGIENKEYFQRRIDFCREYIARYEDKDDLNIKNMRVVIAECHIKLGKIGEGEALFEAIIKEDPRWAWGYIGWSDCYGLFAENEYKNYAKAEEILKKALSVQGLDDRECVLERLQDLYLETNRQAEADGIEKELRALEEPEPLPSKNKPVKNKKIGRNQPCPCGSGKKYKKCCGR